MLKISCADVLVYLEPFHRNSVLNCVLHPKSAKNSLKTLFGVKGRSWSSINLKACYVPICNRFHTIQANNGEITYLGGIPL